MGGNNLVAKAVVSQPTIKILVDEEVEYEFDQQKFEEHVSSSSSSRSSSPCKDGKAASLKKVWLFSRMDETNSTSVEFGIGESSAIGSEIADNTINAPKPLLGMKFNSYEEGYNYYNSYALLMGFGIRKSTVNYSRKTREVVDRKFVCDKEGHRPKRDKIENPVRRETRVGCKTMMRIKLLKDKSWEVTGFIEEHTNHVLSSPDKAKMHRSHQQFHKTQRCKKLIDSLQEEGMPPSTISRVINATNGREGEIVTSQQCIDHIRTQRVNNIGHECISIIRHFQSATANDPEFYFAIEIDSSGQLRSVFWADGRSRASYLKFSDVIVFDVTYRINKSSLPFAPFTGVNQHRQSTLLGCALLADEQEDTFVWLFEEWLKCMHGIKPGAIITDQDRAMCNAIHSVFPTIRHRYCYWHMQKHIIDHLHTLISRYGE
ncbi:protein FAR1-RELATED SEQUENCE 5-like [Asparagus officinalis]|uniref:protein FAR1-RELATED SEQUENCE 5-like n=1 Tax=Asparagus officinalis TaxID=4686 RepID=UPI00098E62C3|nr:protein FAR1-RELATED SEQUENCE 5-like [Asparagus officinalis]